MDAYRVDACTVCSHTNLDLLTCASLRSSSECWCMWTVYCTFMSNLDCCSQFLQFLWIDKRVCFARERVVVIVFFILYFFWLFLLQKKSLLEVGSYLWMLTTVPHRRRVCLSFLVGATASDLGESGGLGFQCCGCAWAELPVSAFWSFVSYVSKLSRSIRLRFVWC